MNSNTKLVLEKNQIERLVKNSFGKQIQVENYEEIKDGWANTIYSIRLSNGLEVILKIAPSTDVKVLRYEKNLMKTEVEVTKRLKRKTAIPVPEIYYYDNTMSHIKNEYFIMEKINGESYTKVIDNLTEKEKKEIEIKMGSYNKMINSIKGDKFGYYELERSSNNWFEWFMQMIEDILNDGKDFDIKLPVEYDEIIDLITKNSTVLNSINEPRLVHWDLHNGNVIVNNGQIKGIIDCDRSLWGDPLIEVCFGKLCKSENFAIGYGKYLNLNKEEKIRRKLYDIYLGLIMYIESFYRNYDDEHKKWAYEELENLLKN
ncbi:MAG: aminoglycoside phosphotransferase family protein [Clostridiales bacterium]